MLLRPRQLQRAGMTGSVPYYGGRLTPAHAAGIKQAATQQPDPARTRAQLEELRDVGILTPAEFDELIRRIG